MGIGRRSFVLGTITSAALGCGGAPARTTDGPLVGPSANRELWVTRWFGVAPNRILVWRRPGSPAGRGSSHLFEKTREVLVPRRALDICAGSEHYFFADDIGLSIARGVPPTLDPRSFTYDPRVCASGGGCGPQWMLVGQATSGVMRFTEPRESRQSLYVLPGGTWIAVHSNSPADLRLGPALASSLVPMPPSDLEPSALQVEHKQPDRSMYEAGLLPSYAGAELASAITIAVFAPGASGVPYLGRVYLPNDESAAKAAADINRQRAELRVRDPRLASLLPADVRVEGRTVVQRGTVPLADVREYVASARASAAAAKQRHDGGEHESRPE